MGSLRKRGDVWWIRYYRNGRRSEESAATDNKKVAQDLLKIREGDIAKGIPVSAKIGQFRFEDAAKDIINDYTTNRKRSLNVLKGRIEHHLTPSFGGRRMANISTPDVRAYIAKRQADTVLVRKARTVRVGDALVEQPEVRRPVSNAEINRELTT